MKANRQNNQNKNRNNKGFSLVELIVVIAIMAVLVAVLAPQFTKYVDRSRQSVDATTVSGIVTAAQVGVADVTDYAIEPATYVITINHDKTTVKKGENEVLNDEENGKGTIKKAIEDACGNLNELKITASKWKQVQIELVVSDEYTVTVDYDDAFKKYIGKKETAPENSEQTPPIE